MNSRVALLPLLLTFAFMGQAQAQSQLPTPPKASPVAAPVTPAQPPALIQQAPAVPALTMPAPSSSVGLSQEPGVPMDLDATTIRLSSHLKSLIDMEKLRTTLDSERQARARAEWKFAEDQKAAAGGASSTKTPMGDAATSSGTKASSINDASIRPYVTSVYSFGSRAYAKIVIDGGSYVAIPGRTLPNGAKVVSVSGNGVVLREHGHRTFVPVQGSSMLPYSAQP